MSVKSKTRHDTKARLESNKEFGSTIITPSDFQRGKDLLSARMTGDQFQHNVRLPTEADAFLGKERQPRLPVMKVSRLSI